MAYELLLESDLALTFIFLSGTLIY